MELIPLGTGAAYAGPRQASSGYLVKGGAETLLVDCGNGVVSRLLEAGEQHNITALVLSHLHADHFLDIFPLFYSRVFAKGRSYPPLPVFLPPGESDRFRQLLEVLRVEPRKLFNGTFVTTEYDPATGLAIGDLALSFMRTRHPVPAYAIRFESDGRNLVYTADTGPLDGLSDFARGCNVMLSEASIGQEDFDPDRAIHLTPALAAQVAADAGAGALLLTHLWPFYDREEMLRQARAVFAATELAEELNLYSV